ncbi:hypothetical protein BH11CYA1_BH11CYA1_21120 [soil metagenome]
MSLSNQSAVIEFQRLFSSLLAFGLLATVTSCNLAPRTKVSEDVRRVRAAKQITLEDKVQNFGNAIHKFKMLPPKGFLFSQLDVPEGQIFTFTTPARKDGRNGVLSVSCVSNKAGHNHVETSTVLTSVLEPLSRNCIEFHEASVDTFDVKGHTFIGAEFSGSYGGYYPIIGYVAVSALENGFYIVQWQDGEANYKLTRKVMLDAFESLEIIN